MSGRAGWSRGSTDGDREALRILLGARRDLTTAKSRSINRLRALLLTGSDTDRALSRGALTADRLAAIACRRGGQHETREHAVRRAEVRRLALAIRGINRELADNKRQLAELVTHLAPRLLAKLGVGPVSAAQAIVSWSHPGRCRDDAAYAALAGASPIPASSGRIVRHRLNRGGDHPRSLVLALSWRSPPREWRICGTRCRAYDVLGFDEAAGVTSCSASSFWRGSSSPPASRTACGCWRRSGSSKFVRTARRYRTVQIRAGNRSSPPQTHSHTTYATQSAGYTYAAGASPEGHRSGLSKARREEQLKTDDTGHADYVAGVRAADPPAPPSTRFTASARSPANSQSPMCSDPSLPTAPTCRPPTSESAYGGSGSATFGELADLGLSAAVGHRAPTA